MGDGANWTRLDDDFFDNDKIKDIKDDKIILTWIRLLTYSSKNKTNGKIEIIKDIDRTCTLLAISMTVEVEVIRESIRVFLEKDMIRIDKKENVIRIKNWNKYQGTADVDRIREQNRERQKRYRDRKKKEEQLKDAFTPPTVEEVREYCSSRNNSIKPEQFVDYYKTRNWMVGKTPMADWKACIRSWEVRAKSFSKEKQNKSNNKFTNFKQRDYSEDDFKKMESHLLNK